MNLFQHKMYQQLRSPTQNPPVAQVLPIPHEILKAEVVAANQIATGAQILPAAQVTPSGLTATEPQSPTTRTDRTTTVAPESIAGPDSVPSTWIRNAVLAKRENPNKDSGELLVDGQKTSARANNKRALESTLTDIKLSSLTLKSGEVETPQSPLYLKPTPLAIVTLQPPSSIGPTLIRQLVADKNDQGLVVNVEFIDITEQTVSNVDDANARSEGKGNSSRNGCGFEDIEIQYRRDDWSVRGHPMICFKTADFGSL